MIETFLLTILILVLTFVEFCRLRKLLEDSSPSYKQVNSDSQMITPGDDEKGKKSRKKALKAIMAQVKGNRDLFLNNKLDELLQEFGGRKCKSMIALDNEKEEDVRKIKSYPLSPKSRKEYDIPISFERNKLELPDNVYAQSAPPNPKGKVGKSYSDANTQLDQDDMKDALYRKDLDLINLENDDGMNSRRDKKNKRRGRKNKYYTQIDEEDDEEADALDEDDLDDDLDIIKEEDEETIKKGKEQKKLIQKQQEEELLRAKQLEEQQQKEQEKQQEEELLRTKQLEEQQQKEQEELKRKNEELKQQEIQKQKTEQERQLKEENEKREKELLLQQEKLEQEQLEKQRLEAQQKEQALLEQQEELKQVQERERQRQLEQERELEEERQRQLEQERDLEEERLRKEQEEQIRQNREDMEASRLEDEIISNKEESLQKSGSDDKLNNELEQVNEQQQTSNIMSKQLKDENKVGNIPQIERPTSVQAAHDTISNNNGLTGNDVVMMEESLQDFQSGKKGKEDESEAAPDSNKRNFNENDILGDLDRDEKGNVIVLQDENGNYVDKQGRAVNERGYLLDKSGNGDIVNNAGQEQKMFDSKDIDERGEIPAPFCVEKYNFNPHNIRGDFEYDKQGKPVIGKNKRGKLVDKKGRRVNKKGFLTDKLGNIIDKNGKKKFDKKQMTSDGDLPKLFNYNGRRYDVNDIIGQFEKDANNNIVINKNKQGDLVDKLGRKVNEKGYLVDEAGHVVDKDGRKIFDKKHIKNGEVPKIFPFTKFNVKNVLGTFEMDPLGNPILDKNSKGQLIDRDGRIVNERGYLIDGNGNVIDKNGKFMFDKEILDSEGEIPKVFRTGLLKSDTASSLSRLMSEIEKNQPSEFDDETMVQNEMRRLGAQTQQQQKSNRSPRKGPGHQSQRRDSGGNTSVDSMMEDTPSNYNIANQRFEPMKRVKKIKEEEESNYDGETGEMAKKRRKKKKKMVAEVFVDPSNKDIKMAKAYGGQAKATVKKKILVQQPGSRMITTPASIQVRDQAKEKLQKLTNSISGYQNVPITSSRNKGASGTDHFRPPGGSLTQTNFMDQSNEASIMAVPEHHLREEKLKQKKMNELHKRKMQKQKGRKQGAAGDPDFEKMFGKDIDEFLEDSDWDIESFEKMSQYSRGSAKSAFGQGRLRGLESIYLQRLETSMKKGQKQKVAKPKAKFRIMHDRFIDDPELMLDGNGEGNSGISASNKNLLARGYLESANTTHMGKDRSEANIFSGNKKYYDAAGKQAVNFEKSYVP